MEKITNNTKNSEKEAPNMAIDNRKERIVQKLINEEELTREEIIFLLENFKEVSKQKIPEFHHLCFIIASVLEVGKDLYYEVIWYFSPFKRVEKTYPNQPRRVKNTQKKRDVYIPYDD